MSELRKAIEVNTKELSRMMPEKASVEMLEHFSDVILLKGMKQMERILDEDEFRTNEGEAIVINPDHKIKAFNGVINLGRLIDLRKTREEKRNFKAPEVPEEYRIV
jgi:hypothetical protein